MMSRRFGRPVTRVVMRLAGVLETSFRLNVKVSLQVASDTCRHTIDRCVRGVVSSGFWCFFFFFWEYGGFLGLGLIYRFRVSFFTFYSHQKIFWGERPGFLHFFR
jgi:hypothetical protein